MQLMRNTADGRELSTSTQVGEQSTARAKFPPKLERQKDIMIKGTTGRDSEAKYPGHNTHDRR